MKKTCFLIVLLACKFGWAVNITIPEKGKNQISFKENKGQVCDQNYKPRKDVLFSGTMNGISYHLKGDGISYQLYKIKSLKDDIIDKYTALGIEPKAKRKVADSYYIYRIDVNWVNVNKNAVIQKGEVLSGYDNYYLAVCPNGVTNVRSYNSVKYKNIYDGIDLFYYSKEGNLKYDYIVKPGADYKKIQLKIKGAKVKVNKQGGLVFKTDFGNIEEGTPIVFQNGKQLNASWEVKNNVVSFQVENYNPDFELIIDPMTRAWGTFYGGGLNDRGFGCALDSLENVYMTGITHTTILNILATTGTHQTIHGGGTEDAFLAKFDSLGVRQWGTYYGGSGQDIGYTCSTDRKGNIFIGGVTNSSVSAIASPGAHQTMHGGGTKYDAFLAKFNTNGIRMWGTYYGGSGIEYGLGCSTDANGSVYLCGQTDSQTSISTSGSHQSALVLIGTAAAYLVKFDSTGVRLWGTYYGGGGDQSYNCMTDNFGYVYLGGSTSTNAGTIIATPGSHQPTRNSISNDAYLVKFTSGGVRLWGTYYGGNGNADRVLGIDIDKRGNVYISGTTDSNLSNSIATPGSFQSSYCSTGSLNNAFLAKFDSSGVRLWGTYYGCSSSNIAFACAVDDSCNVYIYGDAGPLTPSLVTTPGSYQSTSNGSDVFWAKFDSLGNRLYGTYYGGIQSERAYYMALGKSGSIYFTGFTDDINNTGNIIANPGSHQSIHGGGVWPDHYDCFLVKMFPCNNIPSPPGPISGSITICNGINSTYSIAPVPGISSYFWTLPSGWSGSSSSNTISALSGTSGTVSVATSNTCTAYYPPQTLSVTVNPLPPVTISVSSTTLCNGSTATLTAGGANTYTWVSGPVNASVAVSPSVNTSYTVNGTDGNGCVNTVIKNMIVYPSPTMGISTSHTIICGPPFQGTAVLNATGANSYSWSTSSTASGIAVSPSVTTTYSVIGTGTNGCQSTAIITQSVSACTGIPESLNSVQINVLPNPSNGEFTISMANKNQNLLMEIYNPIGQIIKRETLHEPNTKINLKEHANGIYFIKVIENGQLVYTSKIIKQ